MNYENQITVSTFELRHKEKSLGILVTTMDADDTKYLLKEFLRENTPDIENFVDWLVNVGYDRGAYRIFIDDVID